MVQIAAHCQVPPVAPLNDDYGDEAESRDVARDGPDDSGMSIDLAIETLHYVLWPDLVPGLSVALEDREVFGGD